MGVSCVKQAASVLSTYTADISGVNSALYELGGMCVMHDASGCNSTYHTHDEPRWYTMESLIYVSGLDEIDAVMGNDEKLIGDVVKAAKELNPRFIAITGTMIPYMMGTDFKGIAKTIERRTNIPTFAIKTEGMTSYITGADRAFLAYTKHFCKKQEINQKSDKTKINLLGVTPLDFSIVGNVEALRDIFTKNGLEIVSCMAMGSSVEEIENAPTADVNVLLSSAGYSTAEYLKDEFDIPYVTGIPMGEKFAKELTAQVKRLGKSELPEDETVQNDESNDKQVKTKTVIIGEPVFAVSLAKTLKRDYGFENVDIIVPFEIEDDLLEQLQYDKYVNDVTDEENNIKINIEVLPFECEIRDKVKTAELVIADPLYKRILRKTDAKLIKIPHEAYSGRIFRSEIPVFIGEKILEFLDKNNIEKFR